jgi:alpha-tubulin suppressor-like RCC1 family protein
VLGLSNATSITGDGNGFGVYCAITSAGGAKCWGNNGPGTLGNGSTVTSSNTPVSVSGLSNAVALVSGGASFCALLHSGTAECWGSNSYGQLGSGQSAIDSNTPVSVESLGGATTLTTDDTGYCALSSHGVKCWGYNLYGQLGNGNKELSSASPVSVNGLS